MSYCTECLKPCNVIEGVVWFHDRWDDIHETHYTEDVYEEVSDCCEAEVAHGDPPEEKS